MWKKKTIKDLCEECYLYGFSFEDMHEFYGVSLETAKNYYWNIQARGFMKAFGSRERARIEKISSSNMFSNDEMDYGFSGKQKYTWGSLHPTERNLTAEPNHYQLKKYK